MSKILTQIEILTKYVMGAHAEMGNVIVSRAYGEKAKNFYEEIIFFPNYWKGFHSANENQGWMNQDGGRFCEDHKHAYCHFVPHHDLVYSKESSLIYPTTFSIKDVVEIILNRLKGTDKIVRELKEDFSQLTKTVVSHSTSIKKFKTQIGKIIALINAKPRSGLSSDKIANLESNDQVLAICARSKKIE